MVWLSYSQVGMTVITAAVNEYLLTFCECNALLEVNVNLSRHQNLGKSVMEKRLASDKNHTPVFRRCQVRLTAVFMGSRLSGHFPYDSGWCWILSSHSLADMASIPQIKRARAWNMSISVANPSQDQQQAKGIKRFSHVFTILDDQPQCAAETNEYLCLKFSEANTLLSFVEMRSQPETNRTSNVHRPAPTACLICLCSDHPQQPPTTSNAAKHIKTWHCYANAMITGKQLLQAQHSHVHWQLLARLGIELLQSGITAKRQIHF